jgi:hypothetical protein
LNRFDFVRVTEIKVPHEDDSSKRAIVNELYFALSRLGARDELLAIVGCWGDTMDDACTLDYLRAFNRNGTIFSKVPRPQAGLHPLLPGLVTAIPFGAGAVLFLSRSQKYRFTLHKGAAGVSPFPG